MKNSLNATPLLKKQDFESMKVLIIIAIAFYFILFCVRYMSPASLRNPTYNVQQLYTTLTNLNSFVISPISGIIFIATIWMLVRYLTNFQTACTAELPLKGIMVIKSIFLLGSLLISISFSPNLTYPEFAYKYIYPLIYIYNIIYSILDFIQFGLWAVVAYILFMEKNDYVGGLTNLSIGICAYVVFGLSNMVLNSLEILHGATFIIFIVATIAMLVMLYITFSKAEKYARLFGFEKERS